MAEKPTQQQQQQQKEEQEQKEEQKEGGPTAACSTGPGPPPTSGTQPHQHPVTQRSPRPKRVRTTQPEMETTFTEPSAAIQSVTNGKYCGMFAYNGTYMCIWHMNKRSLVDMTI